MPRVTRGTTGADTPPDQRYSLDETGPSTYPPFTRGPQDPFSDHAGPSTSSTAVQNENTNPEVRTLASSERSILETPVNAREVFPGRLAPQSFEARALQAEQGEWERDNPLEQDVGGPWIPKLEERKSYTDLRRMKVVK
jgi:hypothetical protein